MDEKDLAKVKYINRLIYLATRKFILNAREILKAVWYR